MLAFDADRRLPDDAASHVGHVVRLAAKRRNCVRQIRRADEAVQHRHHRRGVGGVLIRKVEVDRVVNVRLLEVRQDVGEGRELGHVEDHIGPGKGVARLLVVMQRQADLLEIVDALRSAGRPRGADCTAAAARRSKPR